MMILPLLLAPILASGDPQAAPAQAAPASADSSNITYAPSISLRSATAAMVEGLPATPVTVRFECLVTAESGTPTRCLPLEGAAKPIATTADFEKRAAAWQPGSASPTVSVALQRVLFTRVRPVAVTEANKTPAPYLMLFSDTVSAGDVVTVGKATGQMSSGDYEMDDRPDAMVMTAYYPVAALHAGAGTRVKANCRVMPSRKLFCSGAELLDSDASLTPEMAADFRNATYQVLDAVRLSPLSKAGDPVVGRDVEMRINFVVPN